MIPVLELFRAQLQRAIEPIDISPYREELVRDLAALKCCEEDLASTLANHIACLKETQKKVLQLEQGCKDSKTLENKMQYSIEVKLLSPGKVAKKKVSELSKEINRLLRTSNAFLQNQKRVKVDVERIDAIVFKTIKDLPDLSALKQATDKYVPLKVAREKALEVMNKTSKELEETSLAMSSERTTHRDIVEELKREIKRTKADIQAITSCNHLMQTSFEKTVTERSSSRADEMKTKRRALEDEIGALEIELRDATTVHKANLLALENNRADLSQQLEATKHKTTVAMKQLEVRFDELQLEHADHSAALDYLHQRQSVETKEVEAAKAQEILRAEKKAQIKAREEKEHYAALWIQLRWKAHIRRQLQKLAASKGKKKGGKKKGKK